mmetsp:Transcript_95423/g.309232  ORF Transcript_95423/g.309232 Transcript_95423/m.309232 type:complete len:232 (-) Transcript_95423:919-1614(-)
MLTHVADVSQRIGLVRKSQDFLVLEGDGSPWLHGEAEILLHRTILAALEVRDGARARRTELHLLGLCRLEEHRPHGIGVRAVHELLARPVPCTNLGQQPPPPLLGGLHQFSADCAGSVAPVLLVGAIVGKGGVEDSEQQLSLHDAIHRDPLAPDKTDGELSLRCAGAVAALEGILSNSPGVVALQDEPFDLIVEGLPILEREPLVVLQVLALTVADQIRHDCVKSRPHLLA